MQKWLALLIVGLVLLIGVIGFEIRGLKQPENGKVVEISNKKVETKAGCEWESKTYELKEQFLIWLSNGCSYCVCGENNSITCQQVDCPEGGLND